MRNFKFRVYDPETKKMEDVYAIDWDSDLNVITCNTSTQKNYNGHCKELDFILMQYTGLKDKNNKEICEGDIIKFRLPDNDLYWKHEKQRIWIGYLEHEPERQGYDVVFRKSQTSQHWVDFDCDIAFDAEIIGNIYINPELKEDIDWTK